MKNKLKIQLVELNLSMITKKYIEWMNSAEILKYTEQRFRKHSLIDIKNFVSSKKKSKVEFLYGIYVYFENKKIHVGNIKLGPIDFNHKTAEISYFIGDIKYHNKGIASLAIKNILLITKKKFRLKKITAGVYSNNISSKKVLLKNKFKLEGILINQYKFKKIRVNKLIYGKILHI